MKYEHETKSKTLNINNDLIDTFQSYQKMILLKDNEYN